MATGRKGWCLIGHSVDRPGEVVSKWRAEQGSQTGIQLQKLRYNFIEGVVDWGSFSRLSPDCDDSEEGGVIWSQRKTSGDHNKGAEESWVNMMIQQKTPEWSWWASRRLPSNHDEPTEDSRVIMMSQQKTEWSWWASRRPSDHDEPAENRVIMMSQQKTKWSWWASRRLSDHDAAAEKSPPGGGQGAGHQAPPRRLRLWRSVEWFWLFG